MEAGRRASEQAHQDAGEQDGEGRVLQSGAASTTAQIDLGSLADPHMSVMPGQLTEEGQESGEVDGKCRPCTNLLING